MIDTSGILEQARRLHQAGKLAEANINQLLDSPIAEQKEYAV
jgi:hypothetical protein